MSEAVRLVVWDLDETFWRGTITEGGIQEYRQDCHDAVITLARRGIMSSICSKNDPDTVRTVLQDKGIWDYFIFPSVSWDPKGARIAALVEAVQLRPASIMFIDDNPGNRGEAAARVPGLQVESDAFIPTMLADPRFTGKDDAALSRLGQYKLLERRKTDEQQAAGSNEDFLRGSDIRVRIEHVVEHHIDRAVELVNRTNQLNFTKRRLPEDGEQARDALARLISDYNIQTGLVSARDRYGDYGYIGFYALANHGSQQRLLQYCFSCRTLGMGIETWLYHRLGRPDISIVGEVLTNILTDPVPDWIGMDHAGIADGPASDPVRVYLRGGCDLAPVAHYLGVTATHVLGEFNLVRDGFPIRADHSLFLRHAMEGFARSPADMAAARAIGYDTGDFSPGLAADLAGYDACLFSFWQDSMLCTYQHRQHGWQLPFCLPPGDTGGLDVRQWGDAELQKHVPEAAHDPAARFIAELRENFDYHPPSVDLFRDTLARILETIPATTVVILLLPAEHVPHAASHPYYLGHFAAFNSIVAQVTSGRPNTHMLQITDYVNSPEEMINPVHFTRMVYYRLYQAVAALLKQTSPGIPRQLFAPASA